MMEDFRDKREVVPSLIVEILGDIDITEEDIVVKIVNREAGERAENRATSILEATRSTISQLVIEAHAIRRILEREGVDTVELKNKLSEIIDYFFGKEVGTLFIEDDRNQIISKWKGVMELLRRLLREKYILD